MLGWMAFCMPITYTVLKTAAQARHELCGPLLGTHANDLAMKAVYPVPTPFDRWDD